MEVRVLSQAKAQVMELADIPDLKSGSLNGSEGSNPSLGKIRMSDYLLKEIIDWRPYFVR